MRYQQSALTTPHHLPIITSMSLGHTSVRKPSAVPYEKLMLVQKEIETPKAKAFTKKHAATLASVKHPIMNAIVEGLYRFETEEQAWKQLRIMVKQAICAKEQPERAVRLWVRGAFVTKEEKAQGGIGNYLDIAPEKLANGRYTLRANKVVIAVTLHPQRKKLKGKHPNWSHPTLKHVQKGTRFETAESLMRELEKLHMDYPEVSIPAKGKVYVIMYQKSADSDLPIRKVVVSAKVDEQGLFFLQLKENETGKKAVKELAKKREKLSEKEQENPERAQGYFSAMVALKRREKKGFATS
jgi:hypothetical protein